MYSPSTSYFHTQCREGSRAAEESKILGTEAVGCQNLHHLNHHTPLSSQGTERVSTASGNSVKSINASYHEDGYDSCGNSVPAG